MIRSDTLLNPRQTCRPGAVDGRHPGWRSVGFRAGELDSISTEHDHSEVDRGGRHHYCDEVPLLTPLRQFVVLALCASAALVGGWTGASPVAAQTDAAPAPVVTGALRASEAIGFTSIRPERILNTRDGTGIVGDAQRLGAGRSLDLRVLGVAGIPSDGVDSVVLNITAVNPSAQNSFITVWPEGQSRPDTSNLNFVRGKTVPNSVISKVSAGGQVSIYNEAGEVDVLADIVGYYADTSDFTGLAPARLLNTRDGTGAPEGKVGPTSSIDLQVTGSGGVPSSGVGAVVLNVTAVAPTAPSFVTVWPAGVDQPEASNLNFQSNSTVPNLVIVKVGAGGKVSLFNSAGSTHLLADVVGYFLDGASYVGVTPARVLNTRDGTGARVGKVGAGEQIDLSLVGVGGLPSDDVRAVVLNMTAAAPEEKSFLTVWPEGDTRPDASSLNMDPRTNVANLVIARLSPSGEISIYNAAGRTDIIADVVGYFDAGAGPDDPDFDLPASNDWSAITWTVNDNQVELREQDRSSGTFATNEADTPFVLDMTVRARNNSVDSQQFRYANVQLDLGSGALIDSIQSDPTAQFPSISLAAGAVADFELAFPIDWTDDLSDARLVFGGDGTYEPGSLALTGPQSPPDPAVGVGVLPAGRSSGGACTNVDGELDYSTRSATWATVIPADLEVRGSGDAGFARQARLGTRWLQLDLDLSDVSCFTSNIFDNDFRLDVDGAFVDNSTFINRLCCTGSGDRISVTLVYQIPVASNTIEFEVVGAPIVSIPTTNLG